MKFSTVFAALGLASVAAASASPADVLKERQFKPRQIVDVCAFVDAPLTVEVAGIATVVGLIDLCLCLSALPVFLETNLVAIAAVDLVGAAEVTALLTALINSSPDKTSACPSGPSARAKRDVNWWKAAECPGAGFSACGIPGLSKAWECVNTMGDIESCGGCMVPLHPSAPKGVDCTDLPGVDSVACLAGSCAVQSCLPGFRVSAAGDSCISEHSATHGTVDSILKAVEYGLEHMPLKA